MTALEPFGAQPVSAFCALLVAGALSAGCRSQAERDAEREIARIAHAVSELRNAPNNAKEPPLERLRGEPCSVAAACELQQVCVQGYSLYTLALRTAARVRDAMRSGSQEFDTARELLDSSSRDLDHAKELMDRCVSLQGELARNTL